MRELPRASSFTVVDDAGARGRTIEVKRLYLPFIIKAICPVCGEETERYLSSAYLSFPILGEQDIIMVHNGISTDDEDFEHEFTVRCVFGFTLRAA